MDQNYPDNVTSLYERITQWMFGIPFDRVPNVMVENMFITVFGLDGRHVASRFRASKH